MALSLTYPVIFLKCLCRNSTFWPQKNLYQFNVWSPSILKPFHAQENNCMSEKKMKKDFLWLQLRYKLYFLHARLVWILHLTPTPPCPTSARLNVFNWHWFEMVSCCRISLWITLTCWSLNNDPFSSNLIDVWRDNGETFSCPSIFMHALCFVV